MTLLIVVLHELPGVVTSVENFWFLKFNSKLVSCSPSLPLIISLGEFLSGWEVLSVSLRKWKKTTFRRQKRIFWVNGWGWGGGGGIRRSSNTPLRRLWISSEFLACRRVFGTSMQRKSTCVCFNRFRISRSRVGSFGEVRSNSQKDCDGDRAEARYQVFG